ncbi:MULTISPECIES: YebC/PmpR family DNA-binding transcriptional regulator [Euryhalocaulis]|uniref:YebC/PmpR family DNA-binding transcriptional regulator n=1 Tax=Euryhalocaulis TaxID=1712422 RepID=UPI00047DBAD3|nr:MULTISPECIES: YebC/PmpR family DNA-binding transcriptional regulator [Euryhalocaulis]MBA4801128.1 YebC/PmpR family DNA-binding transcriptional regulator [Euryhalocaulis sp.]
MAGHSKWANIQHRKGRQDAARSKLFSRLSKEITVAAKMGAPDPDMNPRLRLAIANAKGQSMPKDNIQRAIDKASGNDVAEYEDIRYEGFGPGGVGIIVEVSTDNRNRAAAEVRAAFSKHGGNLGETGAVSFMFDQVGEIRYPRDKASDEEMLEAAIEAGAEDVVHEEDEHVVFTVREDLADVSTALEGSMGEASSTKMIWRPQNTIEMDEDKAGTLLKLLDALDDSDDVQSFYGNYEISDDVMEKLDA